MDPTEISTIILVCIFGSAMLGMWLRGVLPENHLDTETKDLMLDQIQELSPQTDAQRTLQSEAESMAINIGQTRWLLFEQSGSSISTPFLVVVVFWLSMLFVSFGLFAPRNATAVVTLLVSAVSVAGAMFLILEMDHPFAGLIQIPDASLRNAPTLLGR